MSHLNPLTVKAWCPQDLNERRDVITRLYWVENRELPEVMEMMEQYYKFKAR